MIWNSLESSYGRSQAWLKELKEWNVFVRAKWKVVVLSWQKVKRGWLWENSQGTYIKKQDKLKGLMRLILTKKNESIRQMSRNTILHVVNWVYSYFQAAEFQLEATRDTQETSNERKFERMKYFSNNFNGLWKVRVDSRRPAGIMV